jgi:glycosyltransferase involved in cell wall biosynthesis
MIAMFNDCAYVGETLVKYFPRELPVIHIKRSRGLWSKTFGIALKILRTKAELYHVHYLLQDCYIAGKLGKKPLVGHAHGSDLRSTLFHPMWGRIVRYNLKVSDRVLVSTPDILGIARKFREDAEYLPNPVDTKIFYPKPLIGREKKKVLIASDSNWSVKGTDIAIRALSRIKDKVEVSIIRYGRDFKNTILLAQKLGLKLNVLPKVSHEKLAEYFWEHDVVIDRFKLGSLGMVSLEAIAAGRPVLCYVSSEFEEYRDFPLKDVRDEEEIIEAVMNADEELWRKQYAYLMKHHDPNTVAKRVLEIYRSLGVEISV